MTNQKIKEATAKAKVGDVIKINGAMFQCKRYDGRIEQCYRCDMVCITPCANVCCDSEEREDREDVYFKMV